MPGDYILCPRCELNYIRKGEEYCDVCKAELKKGPQLVFAVDEDDEVEETMMLCPICHQNYIKTDEKMCAKCAEEMDFKGDQVDMEKDEEWKNFLDDEEEEKEEVSEEEILLSKLVEEEGSALFDDEEEEEELVDDSVNDEPDDFDFPSDIDASDFEDRDEEDEEEAEDDDEF